MKHSTEWTTPEELRERLLERWNRGAILAARFAESSEFPLRLALRRPDRKDLLDRFEEVRVWIHSLRESSSEVRGFGYQIEWEEVRHRQLGANRLPRAVTIATEGDAVRLIGRGTELRRFGELCTTTLEEFPELRPWLAKKPLVAIEHGDDWPRVLSVLRWFRAHPGSGLYLRQVDAPEVDTKFIESRKGLISELLDRVLPAGSIDAEATGAAGFERRYGLRIRPALLRMRILDEALAVSRLTDVAAPVEQLNGLDLHPERVFVTENDTNALALPRMAGAVVLFGKGYALDLISGLSWLRRARIHYWGDIDTHGFAILDGFRAHFPQASSLLMDRETLLRHRSAWTREGEDQRCWRPLGRLSNEELLLYDDLRSDRLGPSLRLEQERISFGWVLEKLRKVG